MGTELSRMDINSICNCINRSFEFLVLFLFFIILKILQIGVIQVNINPAYKENELEYSLKKVKCKGIIMSETYKRQNYAEMISNICPELDSAKPGELNSKRLPDLKKIIVISEKNIK